MSAGPGPSSDQPGVQGSRVNLGFAPSSGELGAHLFDVAIGALVLAAAIVLNFLR